MNMQRLQLLLYQRQNAHLLAEVGWGVLASGDMVKATGANCR